MCGVEREGLFLTSSPQPTEQCGSTASPNLPAHLLQLPRQVIRILEGGTGVGGGGAQKPQDV